MTPSQIRAFAEQPIVGADADVTIEPLMQLGFGFWGAKVLLSAVELGLFAALADGPLDAETLGSRLGLHPRGRLDFFDALVSLDLLDRQNGRYSNAPVADRYLVPARPAYIGAMLELCNDHLYQDWASLSASLRSGRPLRDAPSGDGRFTPIYRVPASARQFVQAMTGVSKGLGQAIASRFSWAGYRSFVDVGCAQGGVTVQLAQQHRHLSGVGFDLPPVRPIFEEYVASAGLTDRLRFQDGDLYRDPFPSADVAILGHMLHGLDLESKRLALTKAYEALPKDGTLIVFDMIVDDERRRNAFGLLMSLNMLLETVGGFEYTGAECRVWLAEAGFRETRIEPLMGPQSMVVAIK